MERVFTTELFIAATIRYIGDGCLKNALQLSNQLSRHHDVHMVKRAYLEMLNSAGIGDSSTYRVGIGSDAVIVCASEKSTRCFSFQNKAQTLKSSVEMSTIISSVEKMSVNLLGQAAPRLSPMRTKKQTNYGGLCGSFAKNVLHTSYTATGDERPAEGSRKEVDVLMKAV
ncbi:hypothetical protein Tcan_07032 [Toxocara canis]|uniref:Uncharacterized protein n=1 Tax=Toxocara canis TaxID=6265 RepID=A0A0B2VZC6_TOXCA|nr:hypothetical protein Tcan_07032 [Toxocara canis]